jgi:methionyl-tRNA formyltransferase
MPSNDFNFVRNLNLYDIIAPSVNSKKFRQELEKLEADIVIVGSWSERFEMPTINTPKIASINVHPSMLPKYRGPNPYIHVILNNEQSTGITFHLMDVNYDTGGILHQKEVDILPNDTGKVLKTRCCDVARHEIAILLKNLPTRLKNPTSQNEKEATYQPQIHVGSCILDFEKESAQEIDKRIRALNPWLDCVIPYKNQFFTFEKYNICSKPCEKEPTQIVKITKDSLFIVCADHKVIEFSNLKIKSPFSSYLTNLYLKKIIKINTKAI